MSAVFPATEPSSKLPAFALVGLGVILAVAAWLVPANLKSISPALLHAAGAGTPTLGAFGRDLVDLEKVGAAAFVLQAAREASDPRVPALAAAIDAAAARQPGIAAWGGWDPFIDPLFNLRAEGARRASTPVLTFFMPDAAREKLRAYLANSGSFGVQSLLKVRGLTATGRFVPATRPGGQPLDAVILLSALLYQGDRFARPLQREIGGLAQTAIDQKDLGELAPFFMDLLSLGRRLDWTQLSELLHRTESVKTVAEFAHLARVAPDQLPTIYAAALFSDSADHAAGYLIQYGKNGLADLRLALSEGQGAVRLLLERDVPVNRGTGPVFDAASTFVLLHPDFALGLKYFGYVLAAWLALRGLDRLFVGVLHRGLRTDAFTHVKGGALALLFAGLLIVTTEPYLLNAAPASEFQVRLHLPVLIATADAAVPEKAQPPPTMDSSTLLSIGLFASLQVAMYFICLVKIRDIARTPAVPLVKLKLMENEENLFDGGLYVGIAGTATALVLQVLRIIEPNLLAAYASNLFGIMCVAIVKIRHVRNYKRELIMEAQIESKV